ncbi:LysR family transcriptional regulator [Sinorhizobium meliloti CCNWSX0020]|jgi:DNA-binding transcriptional LysR family regulator|uniref:LysR family transcriptional regulator n=3 Tax=Sinorhizobium TaxID=28105 RepID=H0GA69_RHIML|nr:MULTISPECIES: LysR family transcriptional regulator [Sinorhizobium]EHK73802.1 LysR family transcriptional regulator [Sinorhizobium meliloti CCNWSX0020]RVE91791.1 LysR family transcriptional regulator [Sinorhizobium meliloti]RVG60321.1 LysR family transcriptional regulator [Sinorhizobium meliloti]RVH33494.1 LysR family transcriptional regulator [Sinorhizobium meliloti]RVH36727.1 LysR family transcriptional regulator [Sinorhizobium meliloti]
MTNNRLERFAHNLDWNLLRTFVVVVEEGSITAAANRLLLQQPAVSMALKRLEQTIGQKLIDRRPGRFDLTEAGEKLHLQCRDIFAAVIRLPHVLETAGEEITGHLNIHAVSHAHNPAWDRKLGSFFRMHPKVTISMTVATTVDVLSAVERNIATMGLCDGIIPEGLNKSFHIRERYALYCGRGHRLFGVEGVDFHDLRGDPYIAFIADVLGGQHMNSVTAVRAVGSFGQQVRGVSCNVEEVMRLIAANVGIGMLPDHIASESVAAGDLWQLPPYRDLPTTDVFRISNPNSILNPAEAAFLAHVADTEALDHCHHQQD